MSNAHSMPSVSKLSRCQFFRVSKREMIPFINFNQALATEFLSPSF